MKKYIVTPLLVFLFIFLSVLPCSAAENQTETLTYENFEYHNNDNGITIDSYFGSEETVDIPAYIGNKQVTEIADYAFLLCNTVVTVNVPESVATVGDKAFSGASKLTNIHTVPLTKPDGNGGSSEETVTADTESEQQPSTSASDQNGSKEEVSNESGQKPQVTDENGIEQAVDYEDYEDTDSDGKGITIPKTDSVVTIDEKKHLITIDGTGNKVMLDDKQAYEIMEDETGNVKIVNEQGKEVAIDEGGNIIAPDVEETVSKSQNKAVIVVVVIVLAVVLGGGAFYIVRKRHR